MHGILLVTNGDVVRYLSGISSE